MIICETGFKRNVPHLPVHTAPEQYPFPILDLHVDLTRLLVSLMRVIKYDGAQTCTIIYDNITGKQ